MGKKHFCFFETAETGNRTPNSGVKGSGANHYPRAPALSVTEAPQNIESFLVRREETFVYLEPECRGRERDRDLRLLRQAALPASPGPPPCYMRSIFQDVPFQL